MGGRLRGSLETAPGSERRAWSFVLCPSARTASPPHSPVEIVRGVPVRVAPRGVELAGRGPTTRAVVARERRSAPERSRPSVAPTRSDDLVVLHPSPSPPSAALLGAMSQPISDPSAALVSPHREVSFRASGPSSQVTRRGDNVIPSSVVRRGGRGGALPQDSRNEVARGTPWREASRGPLWRNKLIVSCASLSMGETVARGTGTQRAGDGGARGVTRRAPSRWSVLPHAAWRLELRGERQAGNGVPCAESHGRHRACESLADVLVEAQHPRRHRTWATGFLVRSLGLGVHPRKQTELGQGSWR